MSMHARLFAIALMAIPAAANAAQTLFDQSADTIGLSGDFIASNSFDSQNFLSAASFAAPVLFEGFDIYSRYAGAYTLGEGVTLRIRADVGGSPAATDLFTLTSIVSAVDTIGSLNDPSFKRVHADFSPTALAAGSYWFGMSGTTGEIGLNLGFDAIGANPLWQLQSSILSFSFTGSAKAGFRVLGTLDGGGSSGTPEPGSWVMLIAGFGLVGAAMRRRNAQALARL